MITWKKVGRDEYEGTKGKYDFHISPDRMMKCVILDIFKAGVKNSDDAHVDSETHADIEEAKAAAEKYA